MKCPLQVFNYSIQNAANNEVDIFIDGEIVDVSTQELLKAWFGDESSVSFKSFRNQLNAVEANTYNVYVNSPGGIVTDAMAIHDLLIEMQSKGKTVNTKGRGIIASAATYILMAGNNAEMSKNSWFMIHNVAGGVWGDVNDIENYAVTLRKFNDSARDFYSNATGIRKEDITKMMNSETWMTADEAKQKGFVKQVTGDAQFKNSISRDNWHFANTAVMNAYNSAVTSSPFNHQSFIENQFSEMKKFFQNIVDAIKGTKPAENSTSITGEQIAAAVQKPFEEVATEIETQISNQVAEAVKPFTQRITDLETAKGELEKKNGELETEITNLKGGKTNEPKNEGPTPIGSFNKK